MRKLTKALAAVLLVAVVVSVMVLLPTFTASAEEGEATATMTPTSIFDAETAEWGSKGKEDWFINDAYTSYFKMAEKTSANGVKYWNFYFEDSGLNDAGTAYKAQPFIQITPGTHNLVDSALDTDAKDDTDFLVFDFDIGTDSNPFSMIQFQTQFYTYTASGGRGASKQNAHQRIFANDSENVYFNTNKSSTAVNVAEDFSSEWAHVTIIFDTRAGSTNGYLYYNGEFLSKYQANITGYEYLSALRILVGQGASDSIDMANESVNFANMTIKSFPVDYNGELATEFANIGNAEYSLGDFSDLAYTMENLPVTNIAEVTRGGETTSVTSFAELEDAVKPGDTVKLLRDVTRPVAISSGVDANGFNADKLVPDADWLIRTGSGKFLGAGAQEYEIAEDGTKTLITDTLSAYMVSDLNGGANAKSLPNDTLMSIKLLDDVYLNNAKSYTVGAKTLEFNLNGYTAERVGSSAHFFASAASSDVAHLIIRGGTFVNGDKHNLIYMPHDYKVDVIDCDIISGVLTVLDQRNGTITFTDCSITSNLSGSSEACLSVKSYNGGESTANFEGCTLIANTTKPIVGVTSTSSGLAKDGRGRYGSMQNNVNFNDCDIITVGNFMLITTYANENDGANDFSKSNQNYANVVFNGCNINAGNSVVNVSLATLHSTHETIEESIEAVNTFASGLTSDNNISFIGCDVSCGYLLTQTEAGYNDVIELEEYDAADIDGNYTFTTDVILDDTSVNASKSIISNTGVDAAGISFTGETFLSSDKFNKDSTQVKTEVTYADDMELAHSSDATYAFVATTSYGTYTYQLGTQAPVKFYWYVPAEGTDAVDINKVFTLDEGVAGIYEYEWKYDADTKAYATVINKLFKVHSKSNLTLFDSFYYNLFIQADEYDAYKTYIQVLDANGNAIEPDAELANINGVDYYKFQAKSAPENGASDAIKVVMTVEGVYDDSWSNTVGLSVFSYSKNILANSTDDESIALIQAVLNYMAAAMTYEDMDATEVEELIEGAEFAAPGSETIEGSVPGLELSVRYESEISWLLNATEDVTFEVTYTAGGTEMSYSKSLKAGETFEIKTKAYDLVNGLTVKSGDNTAVVTIAGYYNAVSDADAKLLIAAIYNYALAADAYKN